MAPSDAASLAPTLDHAATLDALRAGTVVRWWQTTAFLEVAGPDAASFLDGLCTQAVERIEPGAAVAGLFLDAKAKIIAPAILHRTADAPWSNPRSPDAAPEAAPRLLLETLPELVEPLRAHLARYRLRAKASLAPIDAAAISVLGEGAASFEPTNAAGHWSAVREQARPTWTFIGASDSCGRLVRETLPDAGLPLADPAAVEADRIERGVASLHDLLPGRMPAEVGGMDAAVALDAGCYLGQEPVARLHYRGHANRTLRRLEADGPIEPSPLPSSDEDAASPLDLRRVGDARIVGHLTTWSRAADGRWVALAVLRREVAAGEALQLAGGGTALRPLDAPAE